MSASIRMRFAFLVTLHLLGQIFCQDLCKSHNCNAETISLDFGRDVQDDTFVALQAQRAIKRASWPPPSCSTLVPDELLALEREQKLPQTTADAFQAIYDKKAWGGGDGKGSLSGLGSNLDMTEALCRVFKQTAMKILNDKRKEGVALSLNVLDAPSGDWFWMPSCLHALDSMLPDGASVHYQGLDVAQKAIDISEVERQKFKAEHVEVAPFKKADLTKMEELHAAVNDAKFDLILCHDALQHSPTSQVHAILANFNDIGSYLVVDIDTASHNFKDIEPGQERHIDLTQAPYSLHPLCADENVLQNKGPLRESEGEWFGVFQLPALIRASVPAANESPKKKVSCADEDSPC